MNRPAKQFLLMPGCICKVVYYYSVYSQIKGQAWIGFGLQLPPRRYGYTCKRSEVEKREAVDLLKLKRSNSLSVRYSETK